MKTTLFALNVRVGRMRTFRFLVAIVAFAPLLGCASTRVACPFQLRELRRPVPAAAAACVDRASKVFGCPADYMTVACDLSFLGGKVADLESCVYAISGCSQSVSYKHPRGDGQPGCELAMPPATPSQQTQSPVMDARDRYDWDMGQKSMSDERATRQQEGLAARARDEETWRAVATAAPPQVVPVEPHLPRTVASLVGMWTTTVAVVGEQQLELGQDGTFTFRYRDLSTDGLSNYVATGRFLVDDKGLSYLHQRVDGRECRLAHGLLELLQGPAASAEEIATTELLGLSQSTLTMRSYDGAVLYFQRGAARSIERSPSPR